MSGRTITYLAADDGCVYKIDSEQLAAFKLPDDHPEAEKARAEVQEIPGKVHPDFCAMVKASGDAHHLFVDLSHRGGGED